MPSTTPPSPTDALPASPPLLHEADIGSGEKTPAQEETEEIIRQIPPLPEKKEQARPEEQQQQQQQ